MEKQYLKIDWFRIFQICEEKSPESSNQKYLGKENKDTETQTHVMKLQNIQEGEEIKLLKLKTEVQWDWQATSNLQ